VIKRAPLASSIVSSREVFIVYTHSHQSPTAIREIQKYTFIDDAYIPEFGSSPSPPIVSPIKSSPKKKGGRKCKRSENEVPSSPKPAASKKKKKGASKTAIFDIDEDEEVAEPPLQSITAHLHLETSVEVVGRARGKSVTTTSTKLTQCPPFIFMVKDSFNSFIDAVADAAQTMPWHLTTSRLRWRFETPANLQPKLLTNEVGYTAMINAVKSRRKDQVIFLYIPQPVSHEQVCRLTDLHAYIDLLQPAVEETKGRKRAGGGTVELDDESSPSNSSLKTQIVSFVFLLCMGLKFCQDWLQNRAGSELKELQEKYPIGNHPRFPTKRIYASGGLFWELTSLRLQVWANAIAAKVRHECF